MIKYNERNIESSNGGWIVVLKSGNITKYLGWFKDLKMAYLTLDFYEKGSELKFHGGEE